MTTLEARKLAIEEVSGDCWWIKTFLTHNNIKINRQEKPMKINIKEATKIGLYIEKLETKVRELEENNTDLACQLQANQMAGQKQKVY